jgi:pullulanase/glycogen debranching enzyme
MRKGDRQRAQPCSGYRPCAACERPMDRNACYSFCQGVRCICTSCYVLGFRFDAAGQVVREEVEDDIEELDCP